MVTSGFRILPQDKHVNRQEPIIVVIINEHGTSYSKKEPNKAVAGQATPLLAQATENRGRKTSL